MRDTLLAVGKRIAWLYSGLMSAGKELEVAASLDATPELLRYLPELLADVHALGSRPDVLVELLRPLDLGGARVLDLGCGKGAVGLALARELNVRVVGVDLFEPFLRDAHARARRMGLAARCSFVRADVRDVLSEQGLFDVVVYASLGILGRLDASVGVLRTAVRPAGYLLIDDGYLADGAPVQPGYEDYERRDETRRCLIVHGDRLLRELLASPEVLAAENRRTTEHIRRRAESLARRHPQDAAAILGYVERQEAECAYLGAHFVGATWLLQRGP